MDRPRRALATPGNGIEATVLPEVKLGGYVRFWYCGTLCSGGAMRNGVITRDGLIKIKKDIGGMYNQFCREAHETMTEASSKVSSNLVDLDKNTLSSSARRVTAGT
jgi:hypothetical protein